MFSLGILSKKPWIKSTLLLFSLFTIISFSAFAGWNCKEGKEKVTTKKITLENFTSVNFNLPGDLILKQVNEAAPKTLEVSINDDLHQYITTEIKDGQLIIAADPCIKSDDEMIFTLIVANLEKITVNGSGDVASEKPIKAEKLKLNINGSGDMELELEVAELKTNINGSGDIEVKGTCGNLSANINGSGDFEGEKFETKDADISIQGSGDVNLRVTGNLKATILGSGDVTYSGKPTNVQSNIIGSGDINGR